MAAFAHVQGKHELVKNVFREAGITAALHELRRQAVTSNYGNVSFSIVYVFHRRLHVTIAITITITITMTMKRVQLLLLKACDDMIPRECLLIHFFAGIPTKGNCNKPQSRASV